MNRDLIRQFGRFLHAGLPFCHTAREYSPHLIAFLQSEMNRQGGSTAEALEGTGISAQEFDGRLGRVSVLQILLTANNCLQRYPNIAFAVGAKLGVVACGLYGYAMISSPDRKHLIDVVAKYAYLIDPFSKVSYENFPDATTWQLDPYFSDDPESALYRFSIELKLASALRICRDLFGGEFIFNSVNVKYPAPGNSADYSRIFGCKVQYEQPRNELAYFTKNLVPTPIINPDPITHQLMIDVCEQEAHRLRRQCTLSDQIGKLMHKHNESPLTIDEAAQKLFLNARTLRRRLRAEGTTFTEIVTEQRMSQAVTYLRDGLISIEEIASKLGYCDGSSFRKAFISWCGKSPSQFR